MTDTNQVDAHKQAALNAAIVSGGGTAEVVARATAYHSFLTGKSATAATAATTPAAKPAVAAPAAKPAASPAPGGKAAPAAGAKPAAGKPATAPAAGKPAAKSAGAANKPAPQTAAGAPSSEGYVMADVSKALQKVLMMNVTAAPNTPDFVTQKAAGKVIATKILKDVGEAVAVSDVKPAKYKAIIEACNAAVEQKDAAPAAEDSEFDAEPPVTSDDTVIDSDPPEQTGAGADADDL